MKAVQLARFGDAAQLQAVQIPIPEAAPATALVQVEFAGVNFIDIYMRDGTYAKSATYPTPLPMTPGMEGGGVVARADDAGTLKLGQRVAWCLERGSYAGFARVPVEKLIPVPDAVPMNVATTLMLQGNTAHYLANSAFALQPGHTCLIHAAAGGVGQLLVQLAKGAGATVIATVGSEAKAALAKSCGADHTILYRQQDFAEAVAQITGARGVEVVYDSVGAATLKNSLRCLKRRGYCINYGASSGQAAAIAPLELAEAGSVFLTRPHLADYLATAQERRARCEALFNDWLGGKLKVSIDHEYCLSQAAEAHRRLESRASSGKLLLRPDS